jgi:SdpI/YfhL protein family
VLWVARAAAQRRLGRNRFVGIRTRETLANEEAWIAAHGVAERWLLAAGLAGVAGSLVLLFLRTRDAVSIVVIATLSASVLVGGVALGWMKGARAVGSRSEANQET